MNSECKEVGAKSRTGEVGARILARGQSPDIGQRLLDKSDTAGLGGRQPQSHSALFGVIHTSFSSPVLYCELLHDEKCTFSISASPAA